MEDTEDLFMLFYRGGFRFGVPVAWVQSVAGAGERTELPIWDFAAVCGKETAGTGLKYLLFLEHGECRYCLGAEEVEGIWQQGEDLRCCLEEPVIRAENLYLKEAVFPAGEKDGGAELIFLLDPMILYEFLRRFYGEDRIEETSPGPLRAGNAEADAEEKEEETLDWKGGLEVCAGRRLFYVEAGRVEAVQRSPVIWEVPGAGADLLGISLYGGKLVVYYHSSGKEEIHCGIILRTKRDFFAGIAAERADIAGSVSGRFDELMPGVWEKRIDQA